MDKQIRKSGIGLTLAGVLVGLYFYLTDPVLGIPWRSESPIDAKNEAFIGTYVGIALSVVVILIGLFITTRRASPEGTA